MEYRQVGRSGLRVSSVALGSWLTYGNSVGLDATRACVDRAIERGVNFLDTADVYAEGEAERVLGRALADHRRSALVVATKCYFAMGAGPNDRGLSRKHVSESVDASLRRLGTDYIDLYQCHRFDEQTPLDELVRTMDDLIRRGKILYWGVSCWTAEQIRQVCRIADETGACRPISNQPPYSLLERGVEAEVVPASLELGVGQVVFSPLAQGILSGKYSGNRRPEGSRASDRRLGRWLRPSLTPEILETVDGLVPIAESVGVTLAQLALAWCLHQPGITSTIFGASSVEQLEENVGAASVELSTEVLTRIATALGDVRRTVL